MLRWGPEDGPVVVMALPLFEEANRVRAFAVDVLRRLASLGLAGVLPDYPGQGESLVPLESLSLLEISEAYESAILALIAGGRRAYSVAIRSGALLDKWTGLSGRHHFCPQAGASLYRELGRIWRAGAVDRRLSSAWEYDPELPEGEPQPPLEIGGNLLSADLLTAISVYQLWTIESGGLLRTVRLDSDPAPGDRKLPGAPLWRSVEPTNDPALAQLLAEDIAQWVRACEGC